MGGLDSKLVSNHDTVKFKKSTSLLVNCLYSYIHDYSRTLLSVSTESLILCVSSVRFKYFPRS